jgi:hypothetical protein
MPLLFDRPIDCTSGMARIGDSGIEDALHEHQVEPAAELESHFVELTH